MLVWHTSCYELSIVLDMKILLIVEVFCISEDVHSLRKEKHTF